MVSSFAVYGCFLAVLATSRRLSLPVAVRERMRRGRRPSGYDGTGRRPSVSS